MAVKEIGWLVMDLINVSKAKDKWWDSVNTEMSLRVPYKAGNFLTR
jgi:hypothetical protein